MKPKKTSRKAISQKKCEPCRAMARNGKDGLVSRSPGVGGCAPWKIEISITRKFKIIAIALSAMIIISILLYVLTRPALLCPDTNTRPDKDGCCAGEVYTDMGANGFNCCPPGDGDCFPPIK